MKKNDTHTEILRFALTHLEAQRDSIREKIDHIHRELGDKPGGGEAVSIIAARTPGQRSLSVAARKRIGAAQRKRWAAFHEGKSKAR